MNDVLLHVHKVGDEPEDPYGIHQFRQQVKQLIVTLQATRSTWISTSRLREDRQKHQEYMRLPRGRREMWVRVQQLV